MQTQPESLITITVDLDLPEDFIKACEFCNVSHQQVLETYLNHINFYSFLFAGGDEPNEQATELFKKNNRDRFTPENMRAAKRSELHKAPIKEIVKIGLQKKGSSSLEYINIIKKWHKSLPKH